MILIVGAVMFFAGQIFRFVPFVKQYNFPLRLLGGILLLAGAYFNGGLGVEMEYRARIEEMQKKIELAEAESKKANRQIEKVIEEKTVVIKQDTDATLAEIERLKAEINANCELTPEMIILYNKGIEGKE
jgi:alpha-amylase/alpha-mannosidase (GH57 family)